MPMLSMDELQRADDVEFEDGSEGRVYYNKEEGIIVPSVTTVTNFRVDEEKKKGLSGWRSWFDGSTEKRSPKWQHQLEFKGKRGTIGHYNILSDLKDFPKGDEEEAAIERLDGWEYDGDDAFDTAVNDVQWAYNQFFEEVMEQRGIVKEKVISVEQYVLSDFEYGGQFDLLYEDVDGDIVVSDLKLSSGIRTDYKLQTAAYAKAVEELMDVDVDRIEVIRLYPDKETVEVEDNTDWDRTIDSYYEQFLGCLYKAKQYAPSIEILEEDNR